MLYNFYSKHSKFTKFILDGKILQAIVVISHFYLPVHCASNSTFGDTMIKIEFSKFQTYCKEQLGLSDHSLRAYRQDLNAFRRFLRGYDYSVTVTPELLVKYHQHLRENAESSPATIRRRFVTLRSYFRWFETESGGSASPFVGLRLDLKIPQRLPRPVDRPTLSALFKSARHLIELDPENTPELTDGISCDQITGLVARLLVVTGMRIGEITNLRLRDVMGACSQIRVRGKGNRERTVYVTNTRLHTDFQCYWEKRARVEDSNAYLFLNSRGDRLTEAAFRKRLRTISKTLLIEPHITPHRFRHSAATLLIEEGVDIRIVQRLLGHASISTTEIYTKVSDNSLVAAIERADTLAQVDV